MINNLFWWSFPCLGNYAIKDLDIPNSTNPGLKLLWPLSGTYENSCWRHLHLITRSVPSESPRLQIMAEERPAKYQYQQSYAFIDLLLKFLGRHKACLTNCSSGTYFPRKRLYPISCLKMDLQRLPIRYHVAMFWQEQQLNLPIVTLHNCCNDHHLRLSCCYFILVSWPKSPYWLTMFLSINGKRGFLYWLSLLLCFFGRFPRRIKTRYVEWLIGWHCTNGL